MQAFHLSLAVLEYLVQFLERQLFMAAVAAVAVLDLPVDWVVVELRGKHQEQLEPPELQTLAVAVAVVRQIQQHPELADLA
jgi:hypothetical protein